MVPLTTDTFGLTMHASTAATSARVGVERAQRYCEERGLVFEVVRTQLGQLEYQIAFKCNRPEPTIVPEPDGTAPAFVALPYEPPPPEATPAVRTRPRSSYRWRSHTRRTGAVRARRESSDMDATTRGTTPAVEQRY